MTKIRDFFIPDNPKIVALHVPLWANLLMVVLTICYFSMVIFYQIQWLLVSVIYIFVIIALAGFKQFFFSQIVQINFRIVCLYVLIPCILAIGGLQVIAWLGIYAGDKTFFINSIFQTLSATYPEYVQLASALFLVAVIAPLVEELGFRFVIYRFSRNRFGFVVSSILSSVFFGLAHMGYMDPMKMVLTFVGGVFCCWLYEKTGTILTPFAFHGLNNAWMVL